MTHRKTLLSAALACALALAAPTAAQAATATVTGDDGAAAPLSASPISIRNMSPDVGLSFAAAERRYAVSVTGPTGQPASVGTSCLNVTSFTPERIRYQGNGTYTVKVTTTTDANDFNCAKGTTQTYGFSIDARTSVTAPSGALLTRKPLEYSLIGHAFQVELNPGADSYELRYAAEGVVGPDGGLTSGGDRASVNPDNGQAAITFSKPGTYTLVVRALDFSSSNGTTPWSAPVKVRVLSPFDFIGQPSFSDSRGPKYRIKGTVRETSARGKVTVAIRKGSKGKFKKVARVKIRRGGSFSVGFTLRKPGRYQVRYTYAGSSTVAAGFVIQGIRITRQVIFG